MDEAAPAPVRTGGCQCGAVRYAISAPLEMPHLCHCRMCQKSVGGPFAALAQVARGAFAWTRGAPAVFRSSSVAVREFCAACGTPLVFRFLDSEMIDVTLGSLDQPALVVPERHFGIESRMPWLDALAGLPGKTTAESMAPERQARLVIYQHPDYDTEDDWRPPAVEL